MKKDKNIEIIMECIKLIEEQINAFTEYKPLFFKKEKLKQNNNRIMQLESIKENLYKELMFLIDINSMD